MAELQQPTSWGCPINMDRDQNTLTKFITTPSRVCGFILDLMRMKFANPDNIYHERLRIYTYDQDNLKTHIKIEPGFDYLDTENLANLQPGVIVNLGETQVLPEGNAASQNSLAISDGFFTTVNDFACYGGSVIIQAVSPGSLESLLLAEDIFLWLLLFRYQIRDDLHLSKFSVTLLKGPQKPEIQGRSCFVSSVQIEWAAALGFSTNDVKPILSEGLPKESYK